MIFNLLEVVLLGVILWILVGKPTQLGGMLHRRNKIVLDSCALIDGRVVEIVRGGFVTSELVIPQFILNELQLLADGSDSHKRERARYGLDIAHELQDTAPLVSIDRTVFSGIDATDDKLVALAKKLQAQLYTTDYNLGKVAAVEGVQVLNVNELSQSLRPIALPGEMLTIKILQKGSNRDQGVGYLDDGTMIVIEGGARYIGREVPVSVTRMHQTVAGKMVFGEVKPSRMKQEQNAGRGQSQAAAESDGRSNSRSQEHESRRGANADAIEALRERANSPQQDRQTQQHGALRRIGVSGNVGAGVSAAAQSARTKIRSRFRSSAAKTRIG